MKPHIFKFIFISFCILAGICLGLLIGDRAHLAGGIAENVWVGDISLAGLEPKQAQQLLAKEYAPIIGKKINLRYKGQSWELDPKKLGLKLDLESAIKTAYNVGREGNFWRRFWTRLRVRKNGLILKPDLSMDQERVAVLANQLAEKIDRSAKNARLMIRDERVYVVPAITGRRLMVEKLPGLFLKAILQREQVVELPVVEITPKLTTEIVESWGIKTQIAGFSTRFNVANTNRVRNIKLAAAKLDGHIVMPGEEFSFNKIVGTRGVREGYTEAPVIVGGKLVQGVGGGVCQVSSTLYNTVLLADLKATKRSHHSMPVSYLPIGRDAAVAYDYLDLRFKNTLGNALLFKTSVEGDKLRVVLYGAAQNKVVNLESIVEEEISAGIEERLDSSLEPGEKKVTRQGVSGYRVKVWRTVTRGGKLIKRELVSEDYYRPVTKIVTLGPKKEEAKEIEEEVQGQ